MLRGTASQLDIITTSVWTAQYDNFSRRRQTAQFPGSIRIRTFARSPSEWLILAVIKISVYFQGKYTRSVAFKLFQGNRKNQRVLCRDSCLQNKILFGPINSDKIKEATVHGRVVVYLPKKIRFNSEKILYTLGMVYCPLEMVNY